MDRVVEHIKAEATRLGFERCGIARILPLEHEYQTLQNWLNKRAHATLSYMAAHTEMRHDPALLVPGAKSIIVTLMNYRPHTKQSPHAPQIAQYAYGKDYHWLLKARLTELLHIIEQNYEGCSGQVFTDSAPIMERAWAARAGLGFIGKSGMLIAPGLGSYTFIGCILTDAVLEYDEPIAQQCGTCEACLKACPTGAISSPFFMNTERCLSYQTIEKRDPVSPDLQQAANNRLFGCDRCLEVCPWNRQAPYTQEPLFEPSEELLQFDWEHLTRSSFKHLFNGTPLMRAGYSKIKQRLQQIHSQQQSSSF